MENVAIISCASYERDIVYKSVVQVIETAGGLPPLKGKHVLIKPNLLTHSKDCIERGVCTHPIVIYAVTRYVLEQGGIPEIADTPGGKLSPTIMKAVYRDCGITKIADELGLIQNYEIGFSEQQHPAGKCVKSFLIIDAVKNADVIISVCKLKTHVLTHYTGAVKNTFGVIPGLHKSVMHRRFQTIGDFVNMLIDLNELVQPDFVIMDAIIGMEGDGPNNGQPRKVGYLLASSSIYATDVIAQRLIGIDPLSVPTTAEAVKRRKVNPDEISVSGDEFTPLTDFKMPSYYRPQPDWIPARKSGMMNYMLGYFKLYAVLCIRALGLAQNYIPTVSSEKCNGCGACVRYCPGKAINLKENTAEVNLKKCVHCSGCEDVCPNNAIARDTKSHGLGIITHKLSRYLYAYPQVKSENCVGCAQCANICSVDAVHIVDKKAQFITSKCIRCYCCHEMCSYNAIEIVPPPWKKYQHKDC